MTSSYVSLEDQEEYKMMGTVVFSSEEEGYKFYLDYAKGKGFSVRKNNLKRKDGEIIWRQFVCSCEGYRELKHFERTERIREPRALTRCGCLAKLEIERNEEKGVWFVKEFDNQHTHELANPDHVAFLGVHRVMSDSKKAQAVELRMSGLRPFQVMEVMENNHDELDEVGFVMKDLYNFFTRYDMKNIKGHDAEDVLKYLTRKQEEDAEFFFKYTTDEEGRLRNVFWADAESRLDYAAFGGVVIFDSTYRVNKYNLPFIPFIGVNHHRSTTIFGCGILSNESVNSYCWLLETFLEAMRQVHPKSLITDGDLAMAKAISKVMPGAYHRLCTWHIEENMSRHLRKPKLDELRKLIYESMDEEEFERRWADFKENGGTGNGQWIALMYRLREKWAAAYTDGKYLLGMRSNQRSESLNSKLHTLLKRNMSLMCLVKHVKLCIQGLRKKEAQLDAKSTNSVPFCRIDADPLEKDAARIYTAVVFKKVRAQIRLIAGLEVISGTNQDGSSLYVVGLKDDNEVWDEVRVSFKGQALEGVECHCRKMECEDIPCSHIFVVVKFLGFDTIPRCCVVDRWTMGAKAAFRSDRNADPNVWSEHMVRYRSLRNLGSDAFFEAARNPEQTEKAMDFLKGILDKGSSSDENIVAGDFGPMPTHFSSSNQPLEKRVLDPEEIRAKGAPSKRRRPFRETLHTNNQ
ncbi:protein FAR1-RELATED SEQUENCE 5-like [Oryza sativa Japonica Group]|uniref:OSJNBa0050F15.2 protein n=3 Tax=Oryza sativa subsp. japonica TaxID=39947 RepID=Q7XVP7_ORYSJ|nr:OSJNBa0050F15.2 [Oryza sativa Japonica Group]